LQKWLQDKGFHDFAATLAQAVAEV